LESAKTAWEKLAVRSTEVIRSVVIVTFVIENYLEYLNLKYHVFLKLYSHSIELE